LTSDQIEPATSGNAPSPIGEALVAISDALIPRTLKALDRLISSAVDVPVAKLKQFKARIDTQTESYKLVESKIAEVVASGAGDDKEIVQQAVGVLVRKEYRRLENRKAVAAAMLDDMQIHADDSSAEESGASSTELDEDWLNVFERYAEDASSERLQGLWGKVLAGEIRRPGRFSIRTLRFLAEVSQSDAITFERFAENAFGDCAPKSLVMPHGGKNIGHLIDLESIGLIDGASGLGLTQSLTFDEAGNAFFYEGSLAVMFVGKPGEKLETPVVVLTKLGQELLQLVASRNSLESARAVARAVRTNAIRNCQIGRVSADRFFKTEVLWDDNAIGPSATTPAA
jgi:hypothetical protein